MPLTSRERVRRTFAREAVDRCPIDLGAHLSTGISAFAYADLRRHLGLPDLPIRICDPVQFLAEVDDDVRERFGCDLRLLRAPWPATHAWTPRPGYTFQVPVTMQPQLQADGSWTVDRAGARMRMPAGGFFFDGAWPRFDDRPWEEQAVVLRAEAERQRASGAATMLSQSLWAFFSDQPDWLMRAAEDPAAMAAENARKADEAIARVTRLHDLLGDLVDVIDMNADLGAQKAPLIGPRLYERISFPSLQRVIAHIHTHTPWKVLMHSCGSIRPLIPYLVEAGVDALNPVQVSAAGMSPAELKRAFGDRLVFWGGGCDTQRVLGTATPDEVRANVRQLAGTLGAGGGFVFSTVHNVMGNVPPANIVAAFDEARAVGAALHAPVSAAAAGSGAG